MTQPNIDYVLEARARGAIEAAVEAITTTGKPLSTVEMTETMLTDLAEPLKIDINRRGLEVVFVSDGSDIVTLVFYRNEVMLNAYLYLMNENVRDSRPQVFHTMMGLLCGYRSEEIRHSSIRAANQLQGAFTAY